MVSLINLNIIIIKKKKEDFVLVYFLMLHLIQLINERNRENINILSFILH